MKTVAFFNNQAGSEKTSLVYHLALMFAELGKTVLAVDLDPQAQLSAMFLEEDRLEELWPEEGDHALTIQGVVAPLFSGAGDLAPAPVERITPRLTLLPGDPGLVRFESQIASAWTACLDQDQAALRVVSAFHRVIQQAGRHSEADLVLIDVGPNLGAITRSALLSADNVVVPLAADLFSIQGLRNLGPVLREWRQAWAARHTGAPVDPDVSLPQVAMRPLGYVLQQQAVRMDRAVTVERWRTLVPAAYARHLLGGSGVGPVTVAEDMNCLATLRNFRSLTPLAQDARKPMFALKAADGALGGTLKAVHDCYRDYRRLAQRIDDAASSSADRCVTSPFNGKLSGDSLETNRHWT
jgi:cellulose biosynthesis protein BcsQ